MKNQVIILDFGGQYTQLVARRVRENKVYCQVISGDASVREIRDAVDPAGEDIPGAIILSGGPGITVSPDPEVSNMGCPILEVSAGARAEAKKPGSIDCEAIRDSASGREALSDFLFNVAALKPDWTMDRFIERSVSDIRERVGDAHVVAGVSGGVDSTIAAILVHKAIGDNLHPILVDNGLLRKDEARYVVDAMARLGVNLKLVDAQDRFLDRLSGVTDPERKRKIIGEEFIWVFEEEAQKLGSVEYILQGTIYPDVIESGSRMRKVVKSHHNVGGLPERMRLKLLEPVRELFKDEVRLVGEELGLSHEFIWRHPFPGPGLGVRVLGELTREKLDVVREAQAILDDEIRRAGWYDRLWQCFCVLPNVRTVGVTGDERTYGHLIGIRAVHSEDAMTAEWARLPYEVLERVSSRIISEVHDVNRVVLDITSKPPSTIEWE